MVGPNPESDKEREIRILQEMERELRSSKTIGSTPTPATEPPKVYDYSKGAEWYEFDGGVSPSRGWRLFCANVGLVAISTSGLVPVIVETGGWIIQSEYIAYPNYTVLTPVGIGVTAVAESVRAFLNKRSGRTR